MRYSVPPLLQPLQASRHIFLDDVNDFFLHLGYLLHILPMLCQHIRGGGGGGVDGEKERRFLCAYLFVHIYHTSSTKFCSILLALKAGNFG